MSTSQRIALSAAALVVAVAAFVILQPDDESEPPPQASQPATIRLFVRSDVAPGRPVRIRFKADLEGVFEVELEHRAVPIANLGIRA